MSLASVSKLKEIAISKKYPIHENTIEEMCNRGFLSAFSTDSYGNKLYDEYFVENESKFNELLSSFQSIQDHYSSDELYNVMLSNGITTISSGAIEKMARDKFIEPKFFTTINGKFWFKPEITLNFEYIKSAFEDMEKQSLEDEFESDIIPEQSSISDDTLGTNTTEISEQDEDIFDEDAFLFDEEEKPKKSKKHKPSPLQKPEIDQPYIAVNTESDTSPATSLSDEKASDDSSVPKDYVTPSETIVPDSSPASTKTVIETLPDEDYQKKLAELKKEDEKRLDSEKKEEEKRKADEARTAERHKAEEAKNQSVLRDSEGNFVFSGHQNGVQQNTESAVDMSDTASPVGVSLPINPETTDTLPPKPATPFKPDEPIKEIKLEEHIEPSLQKDNVGTDSTSGDSGIKQAFENYSGIPTSATPNQVYSEDFLEHNAGESQRRFEQQVISEEQGDKTPPAYTPSPYEQIQGEHAPLRDEHGNITFSGHNVSNDTITQQDVSPNTPTSTFAPVGFEQSPPEHSQSHYKTSEFVTKAQVAEVSTSSVLSQSGLNEIVEYARLCNHEIVVPLRDGSYLDVEPVSKPSTTTEDISKEKVDYKVSITRPSIDYKHFETEVLFSSVPADNKPNFASISEAYAEAMGVETLKSGYNDKQQEAVDSKVLYAIGVIPQSQSFAHTVIPQDSTVHKPNESDKPSASPAIKTDSSPDYTSIVLPESVQFVHPAIIAQFESQGIKNFTVNNETYAIQYYNKNQVSEKAIEPSAYLGSEETIKRELNNTDVSHFISNRVSESEYRHYAEKVEISSVTKDTVLSEFALSKITEVVRAEGQKIEVPLHNDTLLTFEPVKNENGQNDFRVVLYSPTDGDYSKPHETLIYSSETTETQAINFGNIYSTYASGMDVEKLNGSNLTKEETLNDQRVLFAIGAVSKKEIETIVSNDTIIVPKGISYIHPELLKRTEVIGASAISIDNQTRTISEYQTRAMKIDSSVSQSVFLGSYDNISRYTASSGASEFFKERFEIREGGSINGQKVVHRTIGSVSSPQTPQEISDKKAVAAAVVASSIIRSAKTTTMANIGDMSSASTSFVSPESHYGFISSTHKDDINNIVQNNMLSEKGFRSISTAVAENNRSVMLPLKDGTFLRFQPSENQEGIKTVQISHLTEEDFEGMQLKGEGSLISENALKDSSDAYELYALRLGIESPKDTLFDIPKEITANEVQTLYAIGAVPNSKAQSLIKDGVAELPKDVSYVSLATLSRLQMLGATKVSIGGAEPVSLSQYINKVENRYIGSMQGHQVDGYATGLTRTMHRQPNQSVGTQSPLMILNSRNVVTNDVDKTMFLKTQRGYILSYTDNGERVNLTVLGTLKDDPKSFGSTQGFGVERQIGIANTRINSAYPMLQTVVVSEMVNGKPVARLRTVINPETIQQHHQAGLFIHSQNEILRLSAIQNGNPQMSVAVQNARMLIRNNPQLFSALQQRNATPEMFTAILLNANAKGHSEAQQQANAAAAAVLKTGLKHRTLRKNENKNLSMGASSVLRQLGRLSGLTQGRDYFTTGAKALFGYSSPINVMGDLAKHTIAQQSLFKDEEEFLRNLLVDDLATLLPDDMSSLIPQNVNFELPDDAKELKSAFVSLNNNQNTSKQRRAFAKNTRQLNLRLKNLSVVSFGKDVTRFSTYKLNSILKEGKFNGKELTSEQRVILLSALKIKGYAVRDFSVFNITDNLARRGIKLSRNYNLSNTNHLRALLKELDELSASATFSGLLNYNRLSDLTDDELEKLILNANGDIPEITQALAGSYLSAKKQLENQAKEKIAKRMKSSRLTLLVRRLLSNTEMMAGINAVIMPVEYVRMAKAYVAFTKALHKSIMRTTRSMYNATIGKLIRKFKSTKLYGAYDNSSVGKFIHRMKNSRAEKRSKRIAKKERKIFYKNEKRRAKKVVRQNKKADKKAEFLKNHKKINKAHTKVNKVKGKINKITGKISNIKGKFRALKGRIMNSKPMKLLMKPFDLMNKLKSKLISMFIPVLKWAIIAIVALAFIEGTLSIIDAILGSAQSIIWNNSDDKDDLTDADSNGIPDKDEDNLDLNPAASLTQDRVELCIGLDSTLKVYLEAMCDNDNFETESDGTPVNNILDCNEIQTEKKEWFDPIKDDYTNINKLGCTINGINTGIHYSYYDGDGNEIGLQSNAKDIISVSNAWMFEDYNAKGLYKSYVEKLWCYSHAVAYTPRNYGGKYIYECDLNNQYNPCYNNKYEYECNDKYANLYDSSDGYKVKKMHTDVEPHEYSAKGCEEHTVTYHGGKGGLFNSSPCSNSKTVKIPNGQNSWKNAYYCLGHSDCDGKCKGTETINNPTSFKHEYFVSTSENQYSAAHPSNACSEYTATLMGTSNKPTKTYIVPSACITATSSTGICLCWLFGGEDHTSQITSKTTYTTIYNYLIECKGHTVSYDVNICKGYCPGHELKYCTGHIDADISVVTLFLDDDNGLTKLGVPKNVVFSKDTTVDNETGEDYEMDIEIPTAPFNSLYKDVSIFKNIKRNAGSGNALFPLPDSEDLENAMRLKLDEIDNVSIGSNETIDTLRFLFFYTKGSYPYDQSRTPKSLSTQVSEDKSGVFSSSGSDIYGETFKEFTSLNDLVGSYFTKFATHWWQDTNDQGSVDGWIGQTVNIQHYAGIYQKFSKYNSFEGWYDYDATGKIKTAVVTENGVTKTIYVDGNNIDRAEAIMSDDWKELYDIDFPGSYRGAMQSSDTTLLINKVKTLHGATAADKAQKIINTIDHYVKQTKTVDGEPVEIDVLVNGLNAYPDSPRSNIKYAMYLYQQFGGSGTPFTTVPSNGTMLPNGKVMTDDFAVKYLYSNNKTKELGSSGYEVNTLKTGDAVLIGDEIYIVFYNTTYTGAPSPEGTDVGEIVFVTVSGGGKPRLVAFRSEMFTTPLGFGVIRS